MTSYKRKQFWIDPPLQLQILATALVLVASSLALVTYSVLHGLHEASTRSHEMFHSLDWVQSTVRAPIILSGSISLLAAGLVAMVWSHRYAGPLRVLSAGILRLRHGNLSVPVRVRKLDMHQELIAEFVLMQEHLRGSLAADRTRLVGAAGRLRALAAKPSEKQENREELESLAAELKAVSSQYQL